MKNLKNNILFFLTIGLFINFSFSQGLSVEQMKSLTSSWVGERFEDGRPKVDSNILERMKSVTIEEAWGVLRNEGYHNQFEGGLGLDYVNIKTGIC